MPIALNGLVRYFHYKQGLSGTTWNNIAPATTGRGTVTFTGATLQNGVPYFDGVNDYAQISDLGSDIGSVGTLEVICNSDWAKKSHLINTDWANDALGTFDILYDNVAGTITGVPFSIPTNQTITIAVCSDKKIYVNGVLIGSYATNQALVKGAWGLGALVYAGSGFRDYYKGLVYGVRIYNRLLTADELLQNYNMGLQVGLKDFLFLRGSGSTDNLALPSMTATRIEIDMEWHKQTYYETFLCANEAGKSYYATFNQASGAMTNWRVTPYADGVALGDALPPRNKRFVYRADISQAYTFPINIFQEVDRFYVRGNIYGIKVWNGAVLQAEYDMTTGTVQDVSGNGRHGTLTGGLWNNQRKSLSDSFTLTDAMTPKKNLYLQFDGIDDFIETPSMTFDKVILDISQVADIQEQDYSYILGGIGGGIFRFTGGYIGDGFSANQIVTVNGITAVWGEEWLPETRSILEVTYNDGVKTGQSYLGTQYEAGTENGKFRLHSAKYYNGATLVAHYNMATGSVLDLSGNARHASLIGGTFVEEPNYYLQMDGIDDYFQAPSVTFNEVLIDLKADFASTTANQFYLDARTGFSNHYFVRNGANDLISGGLTVYVNGVQGTSGTPFVPNNERVLLRLVFPITSTDNATIFSRNNIVDFLRGNLYNIKFYNSTTLVAHYDMTKKSVMDFSSNGNHATLVGGTWVEQGAPTGTVYTRNLVDSMSATDILTKRLSWFRTLSENQLLTDSRTKIFLGYRTLSDQTTITDSMNKQAARYKTMNDPIVVSESTNKLSGKRVSSAVNTTDSSSKVVARFKTVNDGVSLLDVITTQKAIFKALNESIPVTDAAINKQVARLKTLVDAIAVSDTLTKQSAFRKSLTDAIIGADSIINQISRYKNLTETVSITDLIDIQFTGVNNFTKYLIETIVLTDSLTKRFAGYKVLNDVINNTDVTERLFRAYKAFSDNVASSDSISKRLSVAVIDGLSLSDIENEQASKILSDSIIESDSQLKRLNKTIGDNIILSDALNRTGGNYASFGDFVIISDAIRKAFFTTKADSVAVSETESESVNKRVSDTVVQSDTISTSKGKATNLNDSIVVIDSNAKSLIKFRADNISVSESENELTTKRLLDSIGQVDNIVVNSGRAVLLGDSIQVLDSIRKELRVRKTDSFVLSDSLTRNADVSVKLYDIILSEDVINLSIPNAPELIGVIKLFGSRELYVYLESSINAPSTLQGGVSMAKVDQDFSMYAGDSKFLSIAVEGVTDFLGCTIAWGLRQSENSNENIILKTTNDDISIVEGKILIKLEPVDTENLYGVYYHECELTDAQGNVSTISTGKAKILQSKL